MSRLCIGTAFLFVLLMGPARLAHAQSFELVPMAGAWRFNDTAADLGTSWKEAGYVDTGPGWSSGNAMFGVEPSVPIPYPLAPSTPIVLGANRISYYFRTHFQVTNTPSSVVLQGSAYVDDGAVFYLNGVEVGRVRLPAQPVTYTSIAQLNYPEGVAYSWTISSAALVMGDNVLAVEVHQNNSSSSDVVFAMNVQATVAEAPRILNASEPADQMVAQGQPVTLSVTGAGIPAPAYQWYRNGAPVSGANASSLTIPNVGAAQAGSYHVVLTNSQGSATSRVAQVSFAADTTPPSFVYALGMTPSSIEVVFSEAIAEEILEDAANWEIIPAAGGPGVGAESGVAQSPTNVTLSFPGARDPGTAYLLRAVFDIPDLNDNLMPADTRVGVATFTNAVLAAANPSWRYEISGADPGPGWQAAAFSDAGWASGVGVFDSFRPEPASASLCRPVILGSMATVGQCISISNAQNTAQISAAYFRTHFQYSGTGSNSVMQFRVLVDDGAAVYLNGAELFRRGLAAGPVSHSTLANRTVGNPVWETVLLATTNLANGDNVLAVELHQADLADPDLTFGLELNIVRPTPAP